MQTAGEQLDETEANKQQAASAREYDDKLEGELQNINDGIFALMDKNLVHSKSSGESKMSYFSMVGDCYRYRYPAELATAEAKTKAAEDTTIRTKVAELLRLSASELEDEHLSLKEYVDVMKGQKTVEVPQVVHIDRIVDVSVALQRQAPMIQKLLKTVEVPQVQYIGKIGDVSVVTQRGVITIQTVQ